MGKKKTDVRVLNKNGTLLDIIKEFTGYKGTATTRLFLSELGYGTRFSDPRIAEGLNTWLNVNGYSNQINHLIISGGIFPEFPPLYSVGNAERMRLLDQDPEKKETPTSPRIENLFEHLLGPKDAANFAEYRKKWLTGKINTWEDCKQMASKQLETTLSGMEISRIDYCHGDEDRFNMRYEEELKVNRLAKEARGYIKSLKDQLKELEKEVVVYSRERADESVKFAKINVELSVLKSIKPKLTKHLRSKKPKVKEFINRLISENEDGLFQDLNQKQKDDLRRRLKTIEDETSFNVLYQDKADVTKNSETKRKEAGKNLNDTNKKIKPLEEEISVIERQLEQGDAITIFTKRARISPIEAEWMYKSVKDQYIKDLFDCFPEKYRDRLTTHVSGSAKLINITYGEGKDDILKEADLNVINGNILVMHNTRFSSNATSLNGLSDAQQELLWRKALEKIVHESKGLIPETIVIAHGAGGLGVTRVNASPEFKALDGSYREEPAIVTIMTLPTMHSTDKLLKFYDKGMNKNWGTKRFAKKMHGTGPVIETILEDGSIIPFTIDDSSLMKIADQKRKMETFKKESPKYKAEEEKLRQMCSLMPKIKAMLSDIHIGAPNFAGTPSNYERFNRSINYLATNYNNLDELILSEVPDGVLPHTESDRKFMGTPLPKLREEITDYLKKNLLAKGDQVSTEDYSAALDRVIDLFTNSLSQNALPNLDQQYEAIRPYIERMVKEIAPNQTTLMSGNHARSREGADEGTRLAGIVREYDNENKIKIVVSDAIGHKFGGQGGVKEQGTGKFIGYHHEPEGGKNALPRTLSHLLSSNYGYDEFFTGHIHTPYVGYANGVAVTIAPACEGPTDYSIKLPVASSPYGTIIKFSNAAPIGHPANEIIWHAWHFVNDNTLERAEYKNDKLDNLLEKLAAPGKKKL